MPVALTSAFIVLWKAAGKESDEIHRSASCTVIIFDVFFTAQGGRRTIGALIFRLKALNPASLLRPAQPLLPHIRRCCWNRRGGCRRLHAFFFFRRLRLTGGA